MQSDISRRTFIKSTAGIVPISISAAGVVSAINSTSTSVTASENTLPMIPFGNYQVSKLVIGSNTVNGGSHLSRFVDYSMKEYFTNERIQEFLGCCLKEGINLFQGSSTGGNLEQCDKFRKSGGSMHYICLINSLDADTGQQIETAKKMGVLGLAHHGEVTDSLFKKGEIDTVRDFLRKIRDAGLLVGLSTHMPAVVEYVEEKGWDLDYYMTCVYERHRSAEELRKLLGYVPLPVREVYLEEDPPRMYKMIQATRRTCLAFKILAAGRLCNNEKLVAEAFKNTFINIKPTDGVIVGMFPRWTDQVKENAELVRKYGV